MKRVKFGVSGHLLENAWRLKYGMLLYPDHLQNGLDYGYGLVIFLILVLFWLSETGQIWGSQAFSGKPIEEMAWDFACWCILTTFSETGQIWGFQAFWSCSVDFPHYCHPLPKIGHIWGFWALSGKRVGVNVEARAEAYFRRFASSSV